MGLSDLFRRRTKPHINIPSVEGPDREKVERIKVELRNAKPRYMQGGVVPAPGEVKLRAGDAVEEQCEHSWRWRRKRNRDRGYWECVVCGLKSDPVGLDEAGRPVEGPPGQSAPASDDDAPALPEGGGDPA